MAFFLWAIAACVFITQLSGCSRDKSYSQDTAQDTVQALDQMLKDGNVRQIPSLIYADDPHMQAMLDRLGPLLDRLHDLSQTAQEKYPTEFATLVEKARQTGAAKAGDVGREHGQEGWDDRIRSIIADPFGTLDQQMSRLDTVSIDDDTCALTIDGKPAFGVGILLRRGKDHQWYFQLPTSLPGLGAQMPQTEAEWKILGYMLDSVSNGINWAEKSINDKEGGSLQDVWNQVMMNVGPNIAVQMQLYKKAVEIHDAQVKMQQAQPRQNQQQNDEAHASQQPGH